MEDRPTQTDLAENGGDQPATNEPWPGVSQAMCAGQSGMATTRDNGYVYDKPLKRELTRGPGWSPSRKRIWGILSVAERLWLKENQVFRFVTE